MDKAAKSQERPTEVVVLTWVVVVLWSLTAALTLTTLVLINHAPHTSPGRAAFITAAAFLMFGLPPAGLSVAPKSLRARARRLRASHARG